MEEVLDVYTLPYDPEMPLVCLDETSKQLVSETRTPLPMEPGQPQRVDYEYERNGAANLFMLFAPLEGWRHVEVTDRRTAIDYANILKYLSGTLLPKAKKIRLVQDNLNTHSKASLYEAFPPAEGSRSASNGATHQNTAAGSTWPSLSWASWLRNAWTAASRIKKRSSGKLRPGKPAGTRTKPRQIGASPPPMPASS